MTTHRPALHVSQPHDARSRALRAQRAHRRMQQVLRHSAERPWTTWVVVGLALVPVLVLLGLALFG